jgi:hypothetical protein
MSTSPHHHLIRQRLSPDRFTPYEQAVNGDLAAAFTLYEWNMSVSAALFETLGPVEVVLRNAIHDRLLAWHARRGLPDQWYDHAGLDAQGQRDVARAKDRATRGGRDPEIPGKVIAELTLGFWRYLLARRYQATLWPAIVTAFSSHHDGSKLSRVAVHDDVQRLQVLRNRIAHHEPVYRRDLQQDFAGMLALASWISPDVVTWVRGLSRVLTILGERPAQP